ncbi:hypothetical protein TRVA0_019S01420 [Trichomonascus vanleenenianus]|uniref:uncharacterized protein n=1 Tax=Trichomonascus vanleenenianus TaxID=2268995 RepID=UPI003ECB78BA
MPNLSVIEIDRIEGENSEGVRFFKSLVKGSRQLKTVNIGKVQAPAITQIAEILDPRVQIAEIMLEDISFVETMADVPATTMKDRGRVQAYVKLDIAENTALLWHYLALLLKKVPGVTRYRLYTESRFSPIPGYTKELTPGYYELSLDRVKQRLLESPE